MVKLDYSKSLNKHKIREKLFSNISNKKIVGLGGPNINQYIEFLIKKGFNDIKIRFV